MPRKIYPNSRRLLKVFITGSSHYLRVTREKWNFKILVHKNLANLVGGTGAHPENVYPCYDGTVKTLPSLAQKNL